MTLGGLALAIGLLVDNATVTIENIHRNQTLGKPLTVAILDGSGEVIQPLTVATLAICIVFFPVVLLIGAGALPVHSAGRHRRAVRCWRPTCCRSRWCRRSRASCWPTEHGEHARDAPRGLFGAVRSRLRPLPRRLRPRCWRRAAGTAAFVLVCVAAAAGGDRRRWPPRSAPISSPPPMSASSSCTIRAPPRHAHRGHREAGAAGRGQRSAQIIPAGELRHHQRHDRRAVLVQPGLRADRQCQRHGRRDPDLAARRRTGRRSTTCARSAPSCRTSFPASIFYFQTADIVSQVLNFGLSAPIDVQIQDVELRPRLRARPASCCTRMQQIPGVADAHIVQVLNYPALQVEVDRLRAAQARRRRSATWPTTC